MDYDNIDYDEGYSMRDIDNSWLNDNMDYEIDSDSDSDIDNYNYNYNNIYNWSIPTRDKINRQTDRYNISFLDRINKNWNPQKLLKDPPWQKEKMIEQIVFQTFMKKLKP